jgi:hypothetical protein
MVSNPTRSRLPVHKQRQPTGDVALQLKELEREVDIMGIDAVLDTLLEYRYDNGIDSEEEWEG